MENGLLQHVLIEKRCEKIKHTFSRKTLGAHGSLVSPGFTAHVCSPYNAVYEILATLKFC